MFTFWDDGEPNNFHDSERCTLIGLQGQGLWHDVSCNSSRSDSLCEKTITKPQMGKNEILNLKITH